MEQTGSGSNGAPDTVCSQWRRYAEAGRIPESQSPGAKTARGELVLCGSDPAVGEASEKGVGAEL